MFRIQEAVRHRDTVRDNAEHKPGERYRVQVWDQGVSPDTPIIPIVIVPVLIGTTVTGFLPERT